MKTILKRLAPKWALRSYRRLIGTRQQRLFVDRLTASARQLYANTYVATDAPVHLSKTDEEIRMRVMEAARTLYGDRWNYYSDALRPEIVEGFVRSIESLRADCPTVDYLEIGSCQGISMALIGSLLRERGMLGQLVSVDPYFDSGYSEGVRGPAVQDAHINVNKRTKESALELYQLLGLQVQLVERTSLEGLSELIRQNRSFDMIYVDGAHEGMWPMTDFGLSRALLSDGGVMILDDHHWTDVFLLKYVCDTHATPIQETWKTVSYRITRAAEQGKRSGNSELTHSGIS